MLQSLLLHYRLSLLTSVCAPSRHQELADFINRQAYSVQLDRYSLHTHINFHNSDVRTSLRRVWPPLCDSSLHLIHSRRQRSRSRRAGMADAAARPCVSRTRLRRTRNSHEAYSVGQGLTSRELREQHNLRTLEWSERWSWACDWGVSNQGIFLCPHSNSTS